MRKGLRMALAGLLAALALASPAAAQDFYQGKTLTVVVGFTPGGGFDVNARLLARYIGRHIPGAPDVVVVNLPGAGSVTAVVRLDASMPTDGTVIDTFNFGLLNDSLLQPDKTKLDFRNYAWIGSISEDITVCYVWRANGPKTIAEMKQRGHYFFGLAGVGTSDDLNTKILRRIFGVDISQVAGYPGSADIRVAIERGELDGDCGAWSSIPDDWTKQAKFSPVSRSAASVPEGMSPDVPYVIDAAPDDAARKIVRFLLTDGAVGRPFIASRAVPPERIAILRQAFAATMKDKDFLAEAKSLRLPVSPKTGEEAAKTVDGIYATAPETIDAARKIVAE
jgi:tripartite-type tricarboxylate transporter receptor subunit TctC